ncbi:OmpH family outer membrane protein [Bremerella cremea]|uniref:OmpH family outer membrane protein n=1 Tax=Bremerella cremea TaxID=1031537 RepID=A0A368KVX3_9BACT|nr:OmpH family outer membrane protein [Bremerella cremea]
MFVQQGVLKVKRFFSCFCVAVALAAFCQATPAWAQNAGSGNIAVIDIPVIFKNHALFKKQMDDLKASVDAAEAALTKERDSMKTMVDELQGYKAGTPEFKALEEKLAQLQAGLQVKVGMQKKDFMEKEARVYYNTYNQVTQTVATFAQRHNITLVLRYNSNDIDPTNRQSVLEGVNRPVIYQNQIDITYDILRILNNGVPQNAMGPASHVPVGR